MLNISHHRFITLPQVQVPEPVPVWMSLYSDEWAGAPRQLAREFCAADMKDCGSVIGLPDQWYFYQDPWVRLTEKLARWLFDIQCLSWAGKRAGGLTPVQLEFAKREWKKLFDDGRCWTNKTGTDTHHDYINGTNIGKGDMYYQVLLLAGNRVDVLSGVENYPESYFGIRRSYPHRVIRAVDIDNLPAPEAALSDPCVCHLATTIKPSGERGIFPQFEGRARGVLLAKGGRLKVWDRLIGLK